MGGIEICEVIVGTYEEHLVGYKLLKTSKNKYCFEQSFTNHAHTRSVKCLAANKKFLVSGSTDETMQLFNLKTRQELGALLHHNGTITGLELFDSFLFSCSEDGSIVVWSAKQWKCEKTLYGHKKAVNDISVHPSGKLLLSVSKDRTLRTWNLIKGRSAYVTNIKKEAEFVHWSPDGTLFLIGSGNAVDIYNVETASVVHKIEFPRRVCTATFITENLCVVAGECNSIEIHDTEKKCLIQKYAAHSNRVKALQVCNGPEENLKWLVSASSDGFIKIFQIDLDDLEKQPMKIAEVNTTCRPTCIAVLEAT